MGWGHDMIWMPALLGLVAGGAPAQAVPTALVLDIGLVRVAPFRPGTNKTWDDPNKSPPADPCPAVAGVAKLVAGTETAGIGAVLAGPVVGFICKRVESKGGGTVTHPVTDPDVFVRLSTGGDVSYRSHTVPNTLSHVFHFQAVVPVDAIPTAGLEVAVQDDDGKGNEGTQENIGLVRLKKAQLLGALRGDGLIRLDDKQGGLEAIEVAVRGADAPRKVNPVLDVAKGSALVADLEVHAGDVIEATAQGEYRIGGVVTGPSGSGANHAGGAMLLTGGFGLRAGTLVAPCARFLSPVSGRAYVAVKVPTVGGNAGDLAFDLTVRAPTAEEWKAGKAEGTCDRAAQTSSSLDSEAAEAWQAAAQKALSGFFAAKGPQLAASILAITHPSGKAPALGGTKIESQGEGLAVHLDVQWRGGLVGAAHRTVVRWELNARRHVQAVVESDTSPTAVARANGMQLNQLFANTLYPELTQVLQAGK